MTIQEDTAINALLHARTRLAEASDNYVDALRRSAEAEVALVKQYLRGVDAAVAGETSPPGEMRILSTAIELRELLETTGARYRAVNDFCISRMGDLEVARGYTPDPTDG